MATSSRLELASLSDAQRDALDAIVKWYPDGGWDPLKLGGWAGTGKGHPHGTGILTPAGFVPVENLSPGDQVIGSGGQPVKVLDTYQRGILPVYRITFNDRSSVRVDGDHLWNVHGKSRESADHVKETRELADTLHKRWGIPLVSAPVEMDGRNLPIDPYILGVLLGDGSLRDDTPRFTPGDKLVPAEVARRLPKGLFLNHHSRPVASQDHYSIVMPAADHYRRGPDYAENPIRAALKKLGLQGKLSAGKFIPDDYLYASARQRLDLLRGLMDTDGELTIRTGDRGGNRKAQKVTGFSSASETLCGQVQFLIESFGGVARKSAKRAPKYAHKGGHRTGQPSYRLSINSAVNPFLTREGWEPFPHYKPKRVIRSIEPDGEAEVTCLRVDAADELYLTEHCIVTHNTTVVSLLSEVLPPGCQIANVAYTGKAVSVLASKMAPGSRLSTLHRLLYQPAVMTLCAVSGEVLRGKSPNCSVHQREREREPEPCPVAEQVSFTPVDEPLAGLDLVVVDEASMVPEQLWADLTSHGVPVLAVGDHGQLPPVRSSFNLMASPDIRLEEIHRQAAGSPVLTVAQWAREQGHIPHGWYGPDVVKIKPHELGYPGFGLHPAEAGLIICATNATRAWHNAAVRSWHGRSGPPAPGDVVICLKNNYDEGLFNGQRGVIAETGAPVMRGAVQACRMTITMEGLDAPWEGAVALAPFGNPPGAAAGIRDRNIALFDFGYALTAHRSQGSQADNVIVIEEGWPDPGTEMRRRWLYTAVTRSAKRLTVAGW